MNLKPWREVAVPHADVLRGTFKQAEFAADLSHVHEGKASEEYQDPARFFSRTFITEGMRLLLDSVVKRLAGSGGDPVIQLQTAFGGGKTHTLLAVYHLATASVPARDLAGIPMILDAAKITELPRARVAVLDGNKSAPNQPIIRDGQEIRTLWGDLAWQLGGAEGVALVADADASGTSPGKAVLSDLLSRFAPCVILVDELVAYIRQFEEGKTLTGGTYDANLSFVQALTEALKTVPTAVMLASLPESEKEAGSQRGIRALATLSHYFGRVQALWKPVAAEEAFEIVRRRLFEEIRDTTAADAACRAFADFYVANPDDFPNEVRESRYLDRLQQAYPIHPEVFDRLYMDWSSLENFQRTRGVLKLMAKVIHRLWNDNDKDPFIMPGNLPLHDADTCNEVTYHLPPGWDAVIDHDIIKEPGDLEKADPRLGGIQACRRAARAIFLGSAPTSLSQQARGIDRDRILLGVALPGQQSGFYADALRRLEDRLHYLNQANNRYWFDTRPNLRREMEERKRRFDLGEHVIPELRSLLQKAIRGMTFDGVHVFITSGDVPDDMQLRLVVLPPTKSYDRRSETGAVEAALDILKNRGEHPRFYQNRLIFLAAANDSVTRLYDYAKSYLAWQQIDEDFRSGRLNLDQLQARQARKNYDDAGETLKRMLREAYKWLLAPVQDADPGKGVSQTVTWEAQALNTGSGTFNQEIERVLKENELLISEWAPIHLAGILKAWFWKDTASDAVAATVWDQMGKCLYMPRLRDSSVFRQAIEAGLRSRDFFAVAQGKEADTYAGLLFGSSGNVVVNSSLLVVTPQAAAAQEEAQRAANSLTQDSISLTSNSNAPLSARGHAPANFSGGGTSLVPEQAVPIQTRFYGTIDLSPAKAKQQFMDIIDDIVKHLEQHNITLTLSLEINAESPKGFDESLRRTIYTNCQAIGFKNAEFEV